MAEITLKLLIDTENQRVVLAEAGKDFVDILFSFLTLPMGTIVRLFGKESMPGCIGNLYCSVKDFDPRQHLQTEACKTMLLRPISSAAIQCEILSINIDDTGDPRDIYMCERSECCTKENCFYSPIQKAHCFHCGQPMDAQKFWREKDVPLGEGFVKEGVQFMIGDDLVVMPASLTNCLSLFQKLGIKDGSALEQGTLNMGLEEVQILLKNSLKSRTPLTDMYFKNERSSEDRNGMSKREWLHPKVKREEGIESKTVNVKLLVDRANKKIVQAEFGEDMANLLFSFLTFPLGAVIKFMERLSPMVCLNNLYISIEYLNDSVISDTSKKMLLSPKLAPQFKCTDQVLVLDESQSPRSSIKGCRQCFWKNNNTASTTTPCVHGVETSNLNELNPKSQGVEETGGGFASRLQVFTITDNMRMFPASLISTVETLRDSEVIFSNLVERQANIGENEAIDLLRASLISETALTDAFSFSKN